MSDRYRIVRFLAEGATSEVYEAFDTELATLVALKVFRSGALSSLRATTLLQRELDLARRVTHPHVCRLYDLGFHVAPRERIAYISMQLLSGPTLSEFLQRSGPLPPARALGLAAQLASALSAAHDAGVLHRDFKSQNIVLVDGHDGETPWAVVTDFGTARLLDGSRGLTVEGQIVGTPTHIAPEQLLGAPLSPRTDIYAFGVVLFEMITGRLPFEAETSFETARMRLTQRPRSPRELVPELDVRWERVLNRCLALEPEARFARPEQVVEALQRSASLPWRRPAALATAMFFVFSAVLTHERPAPEPAAIEAVRAPTALAVLPPTAASGTPPWIGVALGELVTAHLSSGVESDVLSPAASTATLRSLDLESLALSAERLPTVMALMGAGGLLSLSIEGPPTAVAARVELRRAGPRAGEVFVARVGPEPGVGALAVAIASAVRSELGLASASPAESRSARAILPLSEDALRWTAVGLETSLRGELEAALEALEKASSLAPDHPAPVLALSRVWAQRGEDVRARAALERAFELSAILPESSRLELEAEVRTARGARAEAVAIRRLLADAHPGARRPILSLAKALREAGDPGGALQVLARYPSGDAMIALEAAAAHQAVYANDLARREAERAFALAEAWEARPLMAEAQLAQAVAQKYSDHLEDAARLSTDALRAFERLGDRRGVARALAVLGDTRLRQSRFAEARQIQERALVLARALSDHALVGLALHDIARVHLAEGELAAAARFGREALTHFEAVQDREHALWSLELLTDTYSSLGRPEEALSTAGETLILARALGARIDEAYAHHNLGVAHASLGALGQAERELAEAQRALAALDANAELAISRVSSSEIALLRGDVVQGLAHARAAQEAASRAQSGEATADVERQLGACALAEGQLEKARERLERSLAAAAKVGGKAHEVKGELLLAEVAARRGLLAEARARVARAEKLAREGQALPLELAAVSLAARVELAAGAPQSGLERAREARRRGRSLAWREARSTELTLALAWAATGRASEATALFRRVQRSAQAAGAEALAKEARFGLEALRPASARRPLDARLQESGLVLPPLGSSAAANPGL